MSPGNFVFRHAEGLSDRPALVSHIRAHFTSPTPRGSPMTI
jgi:hypothetical protein